MTQNTNLVNNSKPIPSKSEEPKYMFLRCTSILNSTHKMGVSQTKLNKQIIIQADVVYVVWR